MYDRINSLDGTNSPDGDDAGQHNQDVGESVDRPNQLTVSMIIIIILLLTM